MKTRVTKKKSLYNDSLILKVKLLITGFNTHYSLIFVPFFLFLLSCKTDTLTPPDYPSLLLGPEGQKIKNSAMWEQVQRPYILSLFENEVYGAIPREKIPVTSYLADRAEVSMDGVPAIREQVKLIYHNKSATDSQIVDLLIYMPLEADKPLPFFLGLNFNGNHAIAPDQDIFITESWVGNNKKLGITENRAIADHRGRSASRWPLDLILSKGYGLATMYYGDIDPDFHDGFKNGVHRLYYTETDSTRDSTSWATISAWAYGLSTALDYLITRNEVDKDKVIVIGHSRLGKTALWAGATDQRFAIAISNNSGCGGAALSRRRVGETVEKINTSFPHWFCDNFKKYNEKEDLLPIDQHMLIALMAPRPVYIASAEKDTWADPEGEFLSGYYAGDVYRLYKKKILPAKMPELNSPVIDSQVGYHIRTGEHNITRYDWEQYINFADLHFGRNQ